MHKPWCAYGAVGVLPGDHLRPVAKRWREPGATGVSRQVRAFTRYRLPEGEVVTASPFTPCLAPALLWAVAPFVHVGDTEGNVLWKEESKYGQVVQYSFVSQSLLKALVSFHKVMLAEDLLLGTSFYLCLKWTCFGEDSLPISLQYASWAHRKSTRKIAILVHAKHFISNTRSLGGFLLGFVCL